MEEARKRLWYWLDAARRLVQSLPRYDSELSRLNDSHGATMAISPTLELALEAAFAGPPTSPGTWSIPPSCPRCSPSLRPDFDELAHGGLDSRARVGAVDGTVVDPPRPRRAHRHALTRRVNSISARAPRRSSRTSSPMTSRLRRRGRGTRRRCRRARRRTGGALGDLGERSRSSSTGNEHRASRWSTAGSPRPRRRRARGESVSASSTTSSIRVRDAVPGSLHDRDGQRERLRTRERLRDRGVALERRRQLPHRPGRLVGASRTARRFGGVRRRLARGRRRSMIRPHLALPLVRHARDRTRDAGSLHDRGLSRHDSLPIGWAGPTSVVSNSTSCTDRCR